MNRNMGTPDRWIRIIVGIIFVAWALLVATGVWAGALYTLGAIMIVTSLVGTCPVYMPFGISTKKK